MKHRKKSDLPRKTFGEGDILIAEGQHDDRLFLLASGVVSIRKGMEEVARIADRGAIFGEMSMLLDMPSSATVLALSNVEVLVAEDAASFVAANPEVPLQMAQMLAHRLFNATAYLADIKAQFSDRTDHFAMMDKILDELMHQQHRKAQRGAVSDADDPRL